jgi:hypothetical protein
LICTCTECGSVYEYQSRRGHTKARCNSCRANTWASRPDRVKLKEALIQLRGGACHVCGYDRFHGALGFHHLDPRTKAFTIAGAHTRRWETLIHEVRKCVLLCENCHREVHGGVAEIPAAVRTEVEGYVRDLPRTRLVTSGRPRLG